MNLNLEQQKNLHEFVLHWTEKIQKNQISNNASETSDTQTFWNSLIRDIFGLSQFNFELQFEKPVTFQLDTEAGGVKHSTTKHIDLYIPETCIIVEQKDSKKDLTKSYPQSDGSNLTPYEQAKRYDDRLFRSEKANYIVTCNFSEFRVYDMNGKTPEQVIYLKDLENEIYRLEFLVSSSATVMSKEEQLSYDAGSLIGELYKHLLTLYKNSDDPSVAKNINKLCVRLAFCLYAEDAGLFNEHQAFYKYLEGESTQGLNNALEKLFKTLDTSEDERSVNLSEKLKYFPYVNGGLFREYIEIPELDEEFKKILLNQASAGFDWKDISPTIFGAIFESTLNPETRRSGGMHYTSIKNIHKVIDPLFLNDLKDEFNRIKAFKVEGTRIQRFKEFQKKLGELRFLDPACGSGNFLTETYLSLRKLENDIMREIYHGQTALDIEGFENPIYVTLDQFYGIEINDYAVAVAQTAMWIAESQMKRETEKILGRPLEYLPLHPYENIHCANALRIDWNDVVPASKLSHIMGNPPFAGKKEQTKAQKQDLEFVFENNLKGANLLDYVCGWYAKACKYIQGTEICCSFVSTNSITQGEQAPILWKYLFVNYGIFFNFAYKTFIWENESNFNALVYCVIIGFSLKESKQKVIFDKNLNVIFANNISPYLLDAPTVFIENRNSAICNVQPALYGSMPIDEGNLVIENEDEYNLFISEDKRNEKLLKRYLGGEELLNNKKRWCIWLNDLNPKEYNYSKLIMERIKNNKEFREKSNREQTKALAATPFLFGEIRQPKTNMLVIPKVSKGSRKYIPIGYLSPNNIINGSALIIPDAELYTFGLLTSIVHNAWMRTVCAYYGPSYQYSIKVVYNNFIWPETTDAQKEKISKTAQAILDARALYPDSSLADLYEPLTMPIELQKAHDANDKAVLSLYGLPTDASEETIVAHLMKLYKEKSDELNAIEEAKSRSKKSKAPRMKKVEKDIPKQSVAEILFTDKSEVVASNEPKDANKDDSKASQIRNSEPKKKPRQLSIFDMLKEEE